MSSAFVPFLPSGGKTAATAALNVGGLAESASAGNRFAALVPTTAATASTTASVTVPTTSCAHAPQPNAKPVVTLKKDGDRVTHIRIQCGCGEVIELECAY